MSAMDLTKIPLFQMITKRMGWLAERQKVIAENIANADTPEYRPKDLKAFDFRNFLREGSSKLKLATTADQHFAPASTERFQVKSDAKPFENTPSQNKVVLEEQIAKMGETKSDYELTSNLYSKHVAMIKTALGRGA
jgi:flagellar basal-body rod protein FlgB